MYLITTAYYYIVFTYSFHTSLMEASPTKQPAIVPNKSLVTSLRSALHSITISSSHLQFPFPLLGISQPHHDSQYNQRQHINNNIMSHQFATQPQQTIHPRHPLLLFPRAQISPYSHAYHHTSPSANPAPSPTTSYPHHLLPYSVLPSKPQSPKAPLQQTHHTLPLPLPLITQLLIQHGPRRRLLDRRRANGRFAARAMSHQR